MTILDINIDGWVYFITWSGTAPVKIGFSADPDERLRQLQTANPYRLYIAGVTLCKSDYERKLHARFRGSRMEGEWFRRGPKLNRLIEESDKDWRRISPSDYAPANPVIRIETSAQVTIAVYVVVDSDDGGFYLRTQNKVVAEMFVEKMAGNSQMVARRGALALVRKGLT